jgi:hypothetical protein
MGCDYVVGNNIEVCASFGNSARVSGLFEAELSECNMKGKLCGVSTGEALSRDSVYATKQTAGWLVTRRGLIGECAGAVRITFRLR